MKLSRVISRCFRGAVYFPKTLYLNFSVLPFKDAVKLPFVVMGKCKLNGINKKSVKVNGKIKTGMIKIAAQKTSKRGIPVNKSAYLICDDGGKIIFDGSASIGGGTSICASGGKIRLGDKFSCNVNCFVYSNEEITFGEDVLLGWNINLRDNDGHPLYDEKHNVINPPKKIEIGDHVWIASYVDILKGVSLANGTVVGTRSLVTKSFASKNAVIAGSPAKTVKENIYWEH